MFAFVAVTFQQRSRKSGTLGLLQTKLYILGNFLLFSFDMFSQKSIQI